MTDPAASSVGPALAVPHAPPQSAARSTWKARLLALFVTWHLVAVVVYVLPYPPYIDDASLARQESREEMHRLFSTLKPLTPWWKTEEEVQTNVIRIARSYTDGYFKARKIFEPYLEATGTTQTWNMFGGTPPRYPMVFMLEIMPRGENTWIVFQDMNWGTPSFDAIGFRHFEVQGNLSGGGWDKHREWYARHWAKKWNALHPNRPASWVHTFYLRLQTPSAERVQSGDNDRKPERVMHWYWPVPADLAGK